MSKVQIIKQVDAIEDAGEIVLHVNMDALAQSAKGWGGHSLVRVLLDGERGSTNAWLAFEADARGELNARLDVYGKQKPMRMAIRRSNLFRRQV